jgi:eukaryotic-like serine/threonine-protein kinase
VTTDYKRDISAAAGRLRMDSLQPTRNSAERQKSGSENQREGASVSLYMRLWSYGGPQGMLTDLIWSQDPPVTELVHDVIGEGHGTIVEEHLSTVVARFSDPLQALSTAKFLQLKLLTLHRHPPACQVVAAIMVDDQYAANLPGINAPLLPFQREILHAPNSAQILVTERIYEFARNIPGFEFTSKPAHESADGTASGTLYELRWTDESTYGHLRKTSETPAPAQPQRRYTIQSELGRGCMGIVYKAYDEVIGRPVALKTIAVNRSFPNRDELIERLKQEAKAAGSLDHPNIITIFDVGQEEDLVYLSMQLLEGRTLMSLVNEGDLPPLSTLLTYADQILSAVGYAHQRNVIHRDLKPANFMLTSQGVIKILDFGIAKIEDAALTQAGMIVGTPTYMAPEQARAKKVDQRSDIFSLGSVFYELFTRERPFKGDVTTVLYKLIHEDPVPPSVINPALPPGIDAIIRKALAKDPADRFQSCEEMRVALQEQAVLLKDGPEVSASKTPAAPKVKPVTVDDLLAEVKPRRSHASLWFGLVACVVLGATAVGVWAVRVKVRTGSFPPMVERLLAKFHSGSQSVEAKPPQTASPDAQTSDAQPPSTTGSPENANNVSSATTAQPSGAPANSENSQPVADASSAAQPTQPASPGTDNAKAQSTPDKAIASTAGKEQSATSDDSATTQGAEENPFKPRKQSEKASGSHAVESDIRVEGFTRRDVPMLLTKADAASGRGDYSLARYEYNLVLKLDSRNAAARAGLRRVMAAEQDATQR